MSKNESKLTILGASSNEFDSVSKIIENTHPHECIISIHKIENNFFNERFEICREMLKNKRNKEPEELLAFHGCSFNSAKNIAYNGFLKEKNNISAYGKGTYFGGIYEVSKSYSLQKKDYEYNTLVISKILLGKRGRTTSNGEINLDKMDCSVSELEGIPKIICLPIDEAAKPLYIVQFYK